MTERNDCINCEDRSAGCHGRCEKYREYKARLETVNAEKQKGVEYREYRRDKDARIKKTNKRHRSS